MTPWLPLRKSRRDDEDRDEDGGKEEGTGGRRPRGDFHRRVSELV